MRANLLDVHEEIALKEIFSFLVLLRPFVRLDLHDL